MTQLAALLAVIVTAYVWLWIGWRVTGVKWTNPKTLREGVRNLVNAALWPRALWRD